MPTTILHGETYESAKHRRFQEEAAEILQMSVPAVDLSFAVAVWHRQPQGTTICADCEAVCRRLAAPLLDTGAK